MNSSHHCFALVGPLLHGAIIISTLVLRPEILYYKEICHLQLKNVDLYVCPASFILSRVSDQLIL